MCIACPPPPFLAHKAQKDGEPAVAARLESVIRTVWAEKQKTLSPEVSE